MTEPDALAPLEHRIGTREAARFLGVSVRQVQAFVAAGLLDAIDMHGATAKRPLWTVTMASVRRLIASRQPENKAAQGAHEK